MSVERLEVDHAAARLGWRHDGRQISLRVADLADAAVEAASGRIVALSRSGAGRLLLFDADGAAAGSIEAPAGYALSHLVPGEQGLAVVGQGDAPHDGWPDWHFRIDAGAASLTRAGPAY